jgi:hypothetical protein
MYYTRQLKPNAIVFTGHLCSNPEGRRDGQILFRNRSFPKPKITKHNATFSFNLVKNTSLLHLRVLITAVNLTAVYVIWTY